MYELIDHTADAGFRVQAATREEVFAEAARALNALLLENPQDVRPLQRHTLTLEADDDADLLHDWLAELLYQFAARHFIFIQFQITLEDNTLVAQGWGESLDPGRHQPSLEIKAITYHQLSMGEVGGRWVGQVIVDI